MKATDSFLKRSEDAKFLCNLRGFTGPLKIIHEDSNTPVIVSTCQGLLFKGYILFFILLFKIIYLIWLHLVLGFQSGTSGKEPTCQCRRCKRHGFEPWVGKIPWRRAWQPTPVFLPGESHGQRSLAGYSPWGRRVKHD